MCGIAGFNLSPNDDFDTRTLAIELLHQIEARGTDATGAAWWEGDTLMVQKDGMKARWFTEFIEITPDTRNAILHTRLGTKGSESNNDNNHPIVTGKIVGVHNGGVWNDDDLFYQMGLSEYRIAEVDTEAIFAAIAYGNLRMPDGQPRLAQTLEGVLSQIEGSAAIAWFEMEGDPNVMHVSRISSSPFCWGVTPNNSFIFASEMHHLTHACSKSGIELAETGRLGEGEYVKIVEGRSVEERSFTPAESYYSYNSVWTSKTTKTTKTTSTKADDTLSTSTSLVKADPPTLDLGDDRTATMSFATAVNNLATTRLDDNFTPYMAHKSVHDHLIHFLDIATDLDQTNIGYNNNYRQREKEIINWTKRLEGQGFSQVDDWLVAMGAHIRPGTSVRTDLPGWEGLYGQVVYLPNTFPDGSYIIRVLVPNERYAEKYESVLVERTKGEFTVVTSF